MVCCRQTASHYFSQCWTRSMLPYSFTKPQWVSLSADILSWSNMINYFNSSRHGTVFLLCLGALTHWGWDKMSVFSQTTFAHVFFNENVWISINIALTFVPKGEINNIPALVQIMAWHHSDDKPLSEAMMLCLLTHICVTRPQWVTRNKVIYEAYMHHKEIRAVFHDGFMQHSAKIELKPYIFCIIHVCIL